jgi:hypothetical protein
MPASGYHLPAGRREIAALRGRPAQIPHRHQSVRCCDPCAGDDAGDREGRVGARGHAHVRLVDHQVRFDKNRIAMAVPGHGSAADMGGRKDLSSKVAEICCH